MPRVILGVFFISKEQKLENVPNIVNMSQLCYNRINDNKRDGRYQNEKGEYYKFNKIPRRKK